MESILLEFIIGGKSALGGLACNILCRTAAAGGITHLLWVGVGINKLHVIGVSSRVVHHWSNGVRDNNN